jgi:hypothetical protein
VHHLQCPQDGSRPVPVCTAITRSGKCTEGLRFWMCAAELHAAAALDATSTVYPETTAAANIGCVNRYACRSGQRWGHMSKVGRRGNPLETLTSENLCRSWKCRNRRWGKVEHDDTWTGYRTDTEQWVRRCLDCLAVCAHDDDFWFLGCRDVGPWNSRRMTT